MSQTPSRRKHRSMHPGMEEGYESTEGEDDDSTEILVSRHEDDCEKHGRNPRHPEILGTELNPGFQQDEYHTKLNAPDDWLADVSFDPDHPVGLTTNRTPPRSTPAARNSPIDIVPAMMRATSAFMGSTEIETP